MALSREEGLVLRTRDLGEADRVVTLLTKERGKIQAVGRGARRVRSRLLAVSQPFSHATYLLFINKRSLHTLSQGDLIQPFRHLREDLVCLAHATYLAELTDLFLPEDEPQEAVFETLLSAFTLLELREVNAAVVARWYELHILNLIGFRPELDLCVACGKHLDDGSPAQLGFSITEGGLLCAECRGRDSAAITMNKGVWQSMRFMLAAPAVKLGALRQSAASLAPLERVLTGYIEYRLEKRPNALTFLRSVAGMAEV